MIKPFLICTVCIVSTCIVANKIETILDHLIEILQLPILVYDLFANVVLVLL